MNRAADMGRREKVAGPAAKRTPPGLVPTMASAATRARPRTSAHERRNSHEASVSPGPAFGRRAGRHPGLRRERARPGRDGGARRHHHHGVVDELHVHHPGQPERPDVQPAAGDQQPQRDLRVLRLRHAADGAPEQGLPTEPALRAGQLRERELPRLEADPGGRDRQQGQHGRVLGQQGRHQPRVRGVERRVRVVHQPARPP